MFSSTLAFGTRSKPLSVVVADDVVEIRELIEHWLSRIGCAVTVAGTGQEVCRLMRAQPVDVIITDIIMPDGDGLEVISEVKRAHPGTRVLAISGGGNHLQATDCLKFAKGMGAHAVLLKPFNREQLLEAVNRLAPGPASHDSSLEANGSGVPGLAPG